MREVTDIKRLKRVYNLTFNEFKEGKWLQLIPLFENSNKVEITYKNGFLAISDAKIKTIDEKRAEEKGKKNVKF